MSNNGGTAQYLARSTKPRINEPTEAKEPARNLKVSGSGDAGEFGPRGAERGGTDRISDRSPSLHPPVPYSPGLTVRPELLSFVRMMEVRRILLEEEEQAHPQTFPFSPCQLLSRLNEPRAQLVDLVGADEWDPTAIRDAAAGVAMYAQLISRRVKP